MTLTRENAPKPRNLPGWHPHPRDKLIAPKTVADLQRVAPIRFLFSTMRLGPHLLGRKNLADPTGIVQRMADPPSLPPRLEAEMRALGSLELSNHSAEPLRRCLAFFLRHQVPVPILNGPKSLFAMHIETSENSTRRGLPSFRELRRPRTTSWPSWFNRRPLEGNLPLCLRSSSDSKRNGGEEETRTPDPSVANAVLSQLSYFPT